jgi:hypothetical protein
MRSRQFPPDIGVLFISGYSDNFIAENQLFDPELMLIQKPVKPHDLARKVREVLDGNNRLFKINHTQRAR